MSLEGKGEGEGRKERGVRNGRKSAHIFEVEFEK
jgi:hypothetical protein